VRWLGLSQQEPADEDFRAFFVQSAKFFRKDDILYVFVKLLYREGIPVSVSTFSVFSIFSSFWCVEIFYVL
jgi:hypothetical protein